MTAALTLQGPATALPAQSESAALLNMIERAARDPSVDIDKLRQLLDMQQTVVLRREEREFRSAMTSAQQQMRPVAQDCQNPQTRSKYSSYLALDKALRPIYTNNGFGLSFDTDPNKSTDASIMVVCDVSHVGGHTRRYHIPMPADGKGAKGNDVMTKTHATGSAVTYGRRYLLKMIFNIAEGEADDDGNLAGDGGAVLTDEQVSTLKAAMEVKNCTEERLLKWASASLHRDISSIAELPSAAFEKALSKVLGL